MTHFFLPVQYTGNVTLEDSRGYMKYESSFVFEKKVNNYTFYLRISDGTPARLQFVGFDRLFGSHYDKYIVTYDIFKAVTTFGPDTFKIPNSEQQCVFVCML